MKIEAEIHDATHLVLKHPLNLPAGRKLVLEVIDPLEDIGRIEMLYGSESLLERAYGPDEPDYSDSGEPL